MFSRSELSKIKTLIRRTLSNSDISVFRQTVEKFTVCRFLILNYMPLTDPDFKVKKAYNLIKQIDTTDLVVDSLVYDIVYSYDFIAYLFLFDNKYGNRDIDECRSGTPTYLSKGILDAWNSLKLGGRFIIYKPNVTRTSLTKLIRLITSSTHTFIPDNEKIFTLIEHITTKDGSILVFEKVR